MKLAQKQRDCGFDNIKCILILLVVTGHLLEICQVPGGDRVYRLIYLFHMPMFMFITGFFTKQQPAPADIVRQCVTYVVFQTAYILFAQLVLKQSTTVQYTKPYWHLWYLLAVLFYTVLVPLYRTDSGKKQIVALIVTFVLAMVIGYDSSVGYNMSLSRFFVFQPFFLMGHYFQQYLPAWEKFVRKNRIGMAAVAGISGVAVVSTFALTDGKWITKQMLYGSYSYQALNYGITHRLVIFLAAVIWIVFFLVAVKPLISKKLPVLSMIGANTMPVYLLHAWVVKLIGKLQPGIIQNWAFVIAACVACVLVFGNPVMMWCVRPRWRGKGC